MIEGLVLALAPVVFLFTLIYLKDHLDPEPLRLLVGAFVLGALTVVPAGVVQYFVGVDPNLLLEMSNADLFIFVFVVIASSEEFFKYVVVRYFLYPRAIFNEPYDGIIYAVAVSLGFAALENVIYVFVFGKDVAWLRMFSAVPLHCLTGVFMGYYMGRAKFREDESLKRLDLLKALFAAIVAHGMYDMAALSGGAFSWVGLVAVLVVCVSLARKAIKIHQRLA